MNIKNSKGTIICLIDSISSGGAQRQMVELAKGFKEKHYKVIFLIYHDIYFYKQTLEDFDIKLIKEDNPWLRIVKIRKFIRASKPDGVISFLQTPNLISILSSFPYRKWKLIVGERSADPKIKKSIRRKIYRWLYIYADFVVANSYENIKIVKEINPLLSNNKCKVLYNIIDQDTWKANEEYIPIKNKKTHLTVAASHRYLKNAKGLIEGINLLKEENKLKLKVSWFGRKNEDDSYKEVKTLVEKYNLTKVIQFYNPSSELPKHFGYSDVIGLFSFHEGLPNTVCEAIVMGKPVIASNISDIPILLGNKKEVLFNPNSKIEIANALEYIISLTPNDLTEIGLENKHRANQLLNRDFIINSYLTYLIAK